MNDAAQDYYEILGVPTIDCRPLSKHIGEFVMGTYDFKCSACGKVFTARLTFREYDQRLWKKCPKCKSRKVTQAPTAAHVITAKKT